MIRGRAKTTGSPKPSATLSSTAKPSRCETCPVYTDGFMSKLPRTQAAVLMTESRAIVFRKRQVIFYEGAPCTALYCVKDGLVKLTKTDETGDRRKIVRLVRPGEILGYRALMANEAYRATAEAVVNSEICLLPRNRVLEIATEEPSAMAWITKKLADDLRHAEDMERDLVLKTAEDRLVGLLVMLDEVSGKTVGTARHLHMELTREEMAEMIGVTMETVVRQLGLFQEQGILELHPHEIIFRQPSALKALAKR